MRIAFISQNPFGLQGTPGTYKLIEAFAQKAHVEVFAGKPERLKADIVYTKKKDYSIHEINYKSREDLEWMIAQILRIGPDILYFCSGQLWKANEAEIISQVKRSLPHVKAVLDIKSPPLIDDAAKARQFREASSNYQHLLDRIFSRSQEDIEEWFSQTYTGSLIYPLGISLDSFRPKSFENQMIYCHRFVYIGALHKRRQMDKLLFFISELSGRIQNKVSFDIYGSGPFYEDMRQIIQDRGLNDIVTLKGSLSQQALFDVLPEYDAGIGWVPYASYDFAPSLKSLEYIASGLVPLLSDTAAHQRLLSLGFDVHYFSLDQRSFAQALEKLCCEGVDSSALAENLERIKAYDWNEVVDTYLYPELLRMVREDSSVHRESQGNTQLPGEKTLDSNLFCNIQDSHIVCVYDSHLSLNTTTRSIVDCLRQLDVPIAVCRPLSTEFDESSIYEESLYVWSNAEHRIEVLNSALTAWQPQVIVLFSSGHESLFFLSQFSEVKAPLLVSERFPPERILAQNRDLSDNRRLGELAWHRDLLMHRADCIHVQHERYLFSLPHQLRSRTHVFTDDLTTCTTGAGQYGLEKIARQWSRLLGHAMHTGKGNTTSLGLDRFQMERELHAARMLEKISTQGKHQ